MKLTRSTLLLLTICTGCGGFFERGDDDESHHFGPGRDEDDEERDHHQRRPGQNCNDAGAPIASDAGATPADSGVVTEPPDSGVVTTPPDAGVPECTSSPDCEVGTTCIAGVCTPCADGQCTCARDDDCPGDQICNHGAGLCEDLPVPCSAAASEAECVARAECQAVYGGMNCTDSNGGECQSGDQDCTCEIFTFAVCIDRAP